MGYVKCPRCNLNFMLESEEFCDVCKAEIGYKKSNNQKETEHIYEYICGVYDEFSQYLNSSDVLCDLKSITFQNNCFPDYSNLHIQQLYLLRYSYAYAYEYKFMYENLFNKFKFGEEITVMSIGCGNMIDYWALAEVLGESENANCKINYIGIDVIDWKNKVKVRAGDIVTFEQTNAVKFFNEIKQFGSDIIFFPKSISEFKDDEFSEICNCFKTKPILKDNFCVCISIRPVEIWGERDIERCVELVDSIKSNGFETADEPDIFYSHKSPEQNIWDLDGKFNYPTWIIDELKNLTDRCKAEKAKKLDCSQCDKMNRSPMLKARYIQYQIFTFCRENRT